MHSTWPKMHKSKLTEIEDRDKFTPKWAIQTMLSHCWIEKGGKFSKDSQDLNNRIKKHNSTDTERMIQPKTIKFTFSLVNNICPNNGP